MMCPPSAEDVLKNDVPPFIEFLIEHAHDIFGDTLPCFASPEAQRYLITVREDAVGRSEAPSPSTPTLGLMANPEIPRSIWTAALATPFPSPPSSPRATPPVSPFIKRRIPSKGDSTLSGGNYSSGSGSGSGGSSAACLNNASVNASGSAIGPTGTSVAPGNASPLHGPSGIGGAVANGNSTGTLHTYSPISIPLSSSPSTSIHSLSLHTPSPPPIPTALAQQSSPMHLARNAPPLQPSPPTASPIPSSLVFTSVAPLESRQELVVVDRTVRNNSPDISITGLPPRHRKPSVHNIHSSSPERSPSKEPVLTPSLPPPPMPAQLTPLSPPPPAYAPPLCPTSTPLQPNIDCDDLLTTLV